MSIWKYKEIANRSSINKQVRLNDCAYCGTILLFLGEREIEYDWDKYGGVPMQYQDPVFIQKVSVCQNCGWWSTTKQLIGRTADWFVMDGGAGPATGMVGELERLKIEDVNLPIDEVRKYLIANYERRGEVNPKLFENVVCSVFGDLGYHSIVTGYSNDGGIDVILEKNSEKIGVQVKRYNNKIEVDQIRSLVGALVLHGMTKGIFVTTSDYQSGGKKHVEDFEKRGFALTLLNAADFYDALKLSQRSIYKDIEDWLTDFNDINFDNIGWISGSSLW